MATKSRRPTRNTQVMHALLTLRELILSGQFTAGERMSELPLVERLGVSRTPVRLALAELEHEGLVMRLEGGGYAVREFTLKEVEDAIELRGVLEGTAARFAAERGLTRRELRLLHEPNDQIAQLLKCKLDYDAFVAYVQLNERFHSALMAVAQSELLSRTLGGVMRLPFAGASAFVLAESEMHESHSILTFGHREHASVIEAIANRQGTRAEALAREHARRSLANLDFVCSESRHFLDMPGWSLISHPVEVQTPASIAAEAEPPIGEVQAAADAGWSHSIA